MELRIRDRKLPKNRIISNSLKTVYGIGRERAIYICACLGIGLHFSINLLNGYLFNCIIVIIKLFFIIEDRLKDLIQQKYEYLYKLKL
jgi:ribosomal protein S13